MVSEKVSDLKNGKKILMISHSCTLKLFTAHNLSEKGKTISNIFFDKANPIYIKEDSLFPYLKVHS